MVKFRMSFLKGYLQKLVVVDYDDLRTWVCHLALEYGVGWRSCADGS